MNIVATMSSLAIGGGAERVMARLLTHWAKLGRNTTLITLSQRSDDWYRIPNDVKVITLGLAKPSTSPLNSLVNNWRRVRSLRDAICDASPHVVVAFIDTMNVLTLLATRGLGVRTVVSERTTPFGHDPGRSWRLARTIAYYWADAIVVQTEAVRIALGRTWGSRAVVIPNPVPSVEDFDEGANDLAGREHEILRCVGGAPFVVAVGRLSHEKGFDLLMAAFARLELTSPDWRLVILGDGGDRAELVQLARRLGIYERVLMPGRVAHPQAIMRRASLYVLSSRYEGFPNTLLEAMACGLPCVSFDCPSGPREIIRDGVDGILVPPENVPALADAMIKLMTRPEFTEKLTVQARGVTDRFGMQKVMGMWDAVLEGAHGREP